MVKSIAIIIVALALFGLCERIASVVTDARRSDSVMGIGAQLKTAPPN
jgi:hypothetical protein